MKPNRFIRARVAALAIVASANFFYSSCFAQGDPLNSWTLTWPDAGGSLIDQVFSIAYGNGMFVAVGNGARLISYDGVHWTTYIAPPIINGGAYYGFYEYDPGIVYGAGMFLTFGTNIQDNANLILKSTNGISWTTIYSSSNAQSAAAYGNNTWVFIGPNEILTASTTSSNWNWTEFQPGLGLYPTSIAYGNGTFVIANGGLILSSPDGIVWQYDSYLTRGMGNIAFGNGLFVSTGWDRDTNDFYVYEVLVSSNLIKWTTNVICNTGYDYFPASKITYGGNYFIGIFGTNVWTSVNAIDWTKRFYEPSDPYAFFAYGEGTFLLVSNNEQNIYQSDVFAPQSNSPSTTLAIATYPGVTINGTAGATYQIQYTTNLNSAWLPLTNFMLPHSPYVWVDTSSPVVGQRFYRSVQLQ